LLKNPLEDITSIEELMQYEEVDVKNVWEKKRNPEPTQAKETG
jgi:hypothetical protein